MKWLISGIIVVAIFLLVLSQLRCVGERERIVVTGPEKTKVTAQAESAFHPDVQVVAELEIGDTLKVLSYEYLKDYMVYEIMMKDGRKGWITLGDNCDWVEIP